MPAARCPLPGARPGRRTVLAALLGAPLLAATGVTGCTTGPASSGPDGPIELSVFWYGGARRAEATERVLRRYTERNPGVTFRVTWQGAAGYYERLATQAVGGNVPDLIQLDDSMLAEYAQREIVLDLTDAVAGHRLDLRGLPPGLARDGQVGGRTVGVPAGQTAAALVVNRDVLRRLRVPEPRAGMAWPEYVAWAQRVTRASRGRVAGTMDPSGDHRAFWIWLRSRGHELYQGRQLGFPVDALVEWFELWQRARAGRATPSAALVEQADTGDPARQVVVTGAAAVSVAWTHQLPELQQLTDADLGLVALPGPTAAQWPRASMYWAAFRGTRHPGVVVDVLNFLTTNAEAGHLLGHERGLPPNLAVRERTTADLTDPALRRAAEFVAARTGGLGPTPPPPPKGHPRVRDLLLDAAESVRARRIGSRDAAGTFVAAAEAALAG
ncbi:carbohydrate ABC transporter substrate-binding protein, CUT1 family (TC 3.A.1.1.-) [Micromonospora nigra]|uniref:Carbohydrate ABC transporter substrate-binding protein, CUT1 family (TC 3.A.1.1.-) n=1 Tax=Micromonospora nigra TaxID=145857 RepID=A0A1C6RPG2_9ACTN|nr:extracellular solute-binding protein [Micromonospora nigra]SCL19093.1 carbohydrate ABC transporter substrate-binding protein, CUT1 family (TC 3.A.1.1.-) [Micromonospora nigra]